MLIAGIIGFGSIGRRTAELFVGVGFGRVRACDDRIEVDAPSMEAASMETERELRMKTAQEAKRVLDRKPMLNPVAVPEEKA